METILFAKPRGMALNLEMTETGITPFEFEQVFKTWFKPLLAYSCTILKDESTAEEIIQQVFYRIWKKKDRLQIDASFKAYLYQSVYNESMNYLKHLKVKKSHRSYVLHTADISEEGHAKSIATKELETKIAEALALLPEQCRTIFQMSRFENLKYREIADALNLSVKTIENQMGKALKIMRSALSEYLPTLFIIFIAYLVNCN